MERPSGLNVKLAAGMIVLFHIVGVIGLMIPVLRPIFLRIVPFHLLLMLIIVLFSHNLINSKYLGFVLLIFTLGFGCEWIGVHKSWLFGSYIYGKTLGVKVTDIPITIGINWFLLIYSTGVTMQWSRIRSPLARIVTGAVILVLLDVMIEPVAIKFDYWAWAGNHIPLKNYGCWFMVSAVMLGVFELFSFRKQSWLPSLLLGIQFVFFALLNTII